MSETKFKPWPGDSSVAALGCGGFRCGHIQVQRDGDPIVDLEFDDRGMLVRARVRDGNEAAGVTVNLVVR